MRCARSGSLGRHVLGDPDWAGRRTCDCGKVRRLPPGTHALPERLPTLTDDDVWLISVDTWLADAGWALPEEIPRP